MLRNIMSFNTDYRGKWIPNFEGTYVIKRAFSGGALILETMDGEEFPRPMMLTQSRNTSPKEIKEQLAKLTTRKGDIIQNQFASNVKTFSKTFSS